MGCSPSKDNVVHPAPNLSSVKTNGSIPENSSATVNGTSSAKHFITKNSNGLDESASNQTNCNEQQNQGKESENVTATILATTTNTTAAAGYNDHPQLSRAVKDTLQHHSNHEYHVLGNQPPALVPKLPHPKATSLRASLRGPGTESQIEFFKMLDKKIEAGPDYEDN